MIAEYSRVQLLSDKYISSGVPTGAVGYVIEVYDDGNYEVEFSDPETGITFAQIVISAEDLIEYPEIKAQED